MAVSPYTAIVPAGPLVGAGGEITPPWRSFLTALLARTGGVGAQPPVDSTALFAAIAFERTAREQGDAALSGQIALEAAQRQSIDNILVPRAQLCTLWSECDLSFLPRTDPGSGQVWIDGTHLAIGSVSAVPQLMLLEDGSGDWLTEDGSRWLWA